VSPPQGGWLQTVATPVALAQAFQGLPDRLPLSSLTGWHAALVLERPGGSNPLLISCCAATAAGHSSALRLHAVVLAPLLRKPFFPGVLLRFHGPASLPDLACVSAVRSFGLAHLSLGELSPLFSRLGPWMA